jgi:hypothetical protein
MSFDHLRQLWLSILVQQSSMMLHNIR